MYIREATMDDLENLTERDKKVTQDELYNAINSKRVFIAEENEVFLGWLRYNLFWDNTPFINMLYVTEHNRGKGYGRGIIEFFEEEIKRRGYNAIMTCTREDESSKYFYDKLGFKKIGEFTLPNGPEEIILAKQLKEEEKTI